MYERDVVLMGDEVAPWPREKSHVVSMRDLERVLPYGPEVLIFGTGFGERMEVPEEVHTTLAARGISTVVLPTQQACIHYNHHLGRRKVAACLHLFC
ncbi:MAG: MTH938/NDUFAF3 family protein [Desulfotomaculales bacterium]